MSSRVQSSTGDAARGQHRARATRSTGRAARADASRGDAARALSPRGDAAHDPAASAEARLDDLGPLTAIAGVGEARARSLAKLGVFCVRDLLVLQPRRLETPGEAVPIASALERRGHEVRIAGRVTRVSLSRFGRRSTLRVTLEDASGSMPALFFNQPWMRKRVAVGDELELEGRVVDAKGPALASPKMGTAASPLRAAGSLVPLYPLAEGVGQELVRKLCGLAARAHAHRVRELVPSDVLARLAIPPLDRAIAEVHAPSAIAAFEAARRRLALERLVPLQAALEERRRGRARGRALRVAFDARLERDLLSRIPFELTEGQAGVVADLRADLARAVPMRRLLQGDVGSGKTVLGLFACMAVAAAGGQSAFLAPTELLCEQHFDGLAESLRRAKLRSALLTGSLPSARRKATLAAIARGEVDVVFGTHALFGADVAYARLALAVIDEQHRFGVAQRARLVEKGDDVHLLLMTATPIPRTLALTLYSDLDTSVLRGRPPGRGAIRTRWLSPRDRTRFDAFLRERLAAGEQAYWVVPRIQSEEEVEETDDVSLRAPRVARSHGAEELFDRLSRSDLAPFGVELVHGRLLPAERAARLARFRSGASRVLVATTVIEVGVDVPRASVIRIDHAERLGLAQLHQLRGRVGRGPAQSWCFLDGAASARARLELLVREDDGFAIAEEDLRLRGMGDLAGVRQAGENAEGLADLAADLDLLLAARELVQAHEDMREAYLPRARAATP